MALASTLQEVVRNPAGYERLNVGVIFPLAFAYVPSTLQAAHRPCRPLP
jgi:hypothetical protein